MSDWVDAAPCTEVRADRASIVQIEGTRVAVFNLGGEFFAIEDVCTHDGGDLATGCVHGDEIVCPRHGARFSIRTGEALSAPAYEATTRFPVRVVDGVVQVRDDRWD